MVSKRQLQAKQQKGHIATSVSAVPQNFFKAQLNGENSQTNLLEDPNVKFSMCQLCSMRFPLEILDKHVIIMHPPQKKDPAFWCAFNNCRFQCDRHEVMIHHKDVAHREARLEQELVPGIRESLETLKAAFMEKNPGIICGARFDIADESDNSLEDTEDHSMDAFKPQQPQQHAMDGNAKPQQQNAQIGNFMNTMANAMTHNALNDRINKVDAVMSQNNQVMANAEAATQMSKEMFYAAMKNTLDKGMANTAQMGLANAQAQAAMMNQVVPNNVYNLTAQRIQAVQQNINQARGKTVTPQRGVVRNTRTNSPMPGQPAAKMQANMQRMGPATTVSAVPIAVGDKMPPLAYKDARTCPVRECAQTYKNSKNVRRHLTVVHKLSEPQINRHWDEVCPRLAN